MKKLPIVIVVTMAISLVLPTLGYTDDGQKTLAATMDVFVFPAEGQDASTQSKHEAECYNWAVANVGTDPFDLAKQADATARQADQAQQEIAQSGQGAGVKGAVGGAAVGALIGEIGSNDPGKGAAYGAAAGAIVNRRRAKRGQQQASQQVEQQAAQAQQVTKESLENFKKAFSVCLEAKKYLVKY
jgi:hypothetical protein